MSDSLARMKGRIAGYQVQEGSFLHDAFAPVAVEVDTLTDETMPAALDAHMPDTATGSDLDRVALAYGVTRKAAAFAVGAVTFTGAEGTEIARYVPVSTQAGFVFLTDAQAVIPAPGTVMVPVTAAQAGSRGNVPAGAVTVLPIAVAGAASAVNSQPMTGGADAESDDSLRERLLLRIRLPSASGTPSDYVRWAVKVIIAGDGMEPADAQTLSRCADYIATMRPIGAQVTVASVSAVTVNITATVSLAAGYTLAGVTAAFSEAVQAYFKDQAFSSNYLSYARVGALLLSVDGVLDYSGLTLNGQTANVALSDEQVPTLGTVVLT